MMACFVYLYMPFGMGALEGKEDDQWNGRALIVLRRCVRLYEANGFTLSLHGAMTNSELTTLIRCILFHLSLVHPLPAIR